MKDFGEPNHIVVWEKLPVDFGAFDGVVEESAANFTDPVKVKLTRKANSKVPMSADDLRGAGLICTSANSDATAWDPKGREVPLDYEVAHYDPKASTLAVSVAPAIAGEKGKLDPPKAGDKFTVLGPMLQQGHKLYMTHCEHCHGVSGDGKGPTAGYFDIKPRDYRLGRFKFTSTKSNDRATRDDLVRTVRQGIPGTYMPSFLLFTDEEVGPIVEYVRWLAMRGEFEERSGAEFLSGQYGSEDVSQRVKGGETRESIETALENYIKSEYPGVADDLAGRINTSWTASEQPDAGDAQDCPHARHARVAGARPQAVPFRHGQVRSVTGRRARGTVRRPRITRSFWARTRSEKFPDCLMTGATRSNRDLTSGIYRGGRRPLDLYRRIYSGIKGTPMPPFGTALKEEEIWDLVNYAMSLPYGSGSENPELPQSKIASASPVGGG